MRDLKWSDGEKKAARRAFDLALQRELASVLAEFKRMAAEAQKPEDMWEVADYLRRVGREIDVKYDYRYSQLIWVLGLLLREGWIKEEELSGLREEKLVMIRRVAFPE